LLSAEGGAEVEAKDSDGRAALHWATMAGQVEAVEALVEAGASLDPDGDQGAQLLGMAGQHCDGEDATERKAATVAALRRLGVGGGQRAVESTAD
jgi:hypothetical protein